MVYGPTSGPRFDPCIRKIPWGRKWQPTPVFFPGKSLRRGAWRATVHGVIRVGHNLATKPAPMQETLVQSRDREDPLEKELAIHFSILA